MGWKEEGPAGELPFRELARRYGADLAYAPMLNSGMFVRDPAPGLPGLPFPASAEHNRAFCLAENLPVPWWL